MSARESGLYRQQAFIDGAWVGADSGASFAVRDPATGALLAEVPDQGVAEARRAIAAAERALPAWRGKTAKERAQILRRWYELMLAEQERLAHIITAEQGKPLTEARGEIAYGAAFIDWFAEEGRRSYGDIIPSQGRDKRILVFKQPVGVTAAITPWNFPSAMIARKAGAALAAGCTMVVKPAELTPLSALALADVAQRAGVPDGVLNVVTTNDPAAVGRELTGNPIVRKITFTGSTEVGKILLRQAAENVQKCSMELGGNAPFIVFEDADLDLAVKGALATKYRNSGQTCVCANRFLVHASVADAFAEKLAAAASALKVARGVEPGAVVGPLIEEAAAQKVERQVADALERGAKLLTGGGRHALGGTFFCPTVLSGVDQDMLIFREETFGPVAAVIPFESEDEAIRLANSTQYGLASYFYSRDVAKIFRVAEALDFGMVGVNESLISSEAAPFGGIKQSGMGREGSKYGIDDYLEIKYVCLGNM
ncbi:MAG: succinate-semialdehyde dehydrogenase (NADP(+)) [Methylocystaceae bacterium]|nr:MAG: succinate-semialdehyde dehydrogenase (NADP(+)) [Methylocystaceae bacterium]